MRIFFKKYKIYDVNEFLKLVEREADKLKLEFLSINVDITRHRHNENKKNEYEIEFSCYIDGYDHYKGETIYESLEKLKRAIKAATEKPLKKPPKIKIKI